MEMLQEKKEGNRREEIQTFAVSGGHDDVAQLALPGDELEVRRLHEVFVVFENLANRFERGFGAHY